jgi:hypothetical protein
MTGMVGYGFPKAFLLRRGTCLQRHAPRLVCAGDAEDTGVYAAQLDAPSLSIELPFQ